MLVWNCWLQKGSDHCHQFFECGRDRTGNGFSGSAGWRLDWEQGRRCHGYFAEQMLRQIRFDLAILGTDGLKDLSGIGVGKPEEMGWERSVLDSANRTIVIADKSKFEVANVFLVGSLKEADLLITNFIEDELRQKISTEIELIETDGQKERRTLKTQIPCSKAEI